MEVIYDLLETVGFLREDRIFNGSQTSAMWIRLFAHTCLACFLNNAFIPGVFVLSVCRSSSRFLALYVGHTMFPVIECISANPTFYKAKVAKDSALRRGNGAFVTPVAAGSHVTRSSKPSGRPPQCCSSTPQSVATTNLS